MTLSPRLRALQRRLHAQTFELLLAEVEHLATENEELRSQLSRAEASLDFWHDQAIELHQQAAEVCNGAPGLTMDGRLIVAGATPGSLHA